VLFEVIDGERPQTDSVRAASRFASLSKLGKRLLVELVRHGFSTVVSGLGT
jgi:hypothetical protein